VFAKYLRKVLNFNFSNKGIGRIMLFDWLDNISPLTVVIIIAVVGILFALFALTFEKAQDKFWKSLEKPTIDTVDFASKNVGGSKILWVAIIGIIGFIVLIFYPVTTFYIIGVVFILVVYILSHSAKKKELLPSISKTIDTKYQSMVKILVQEYGANGYSNPEFTVEALIKDIMAFGKTKEQAIEELYKREQSTKS
jgi:predicted histidine transporter YuiF (NhaC family)